MGTGGREWDFRVAASARWRMSLRMMRIVIPGMPTFFCAPAYWSIVNEYEISKQRVEVNSKKSTETRN